MRDGVSIGLEGLDGLISAVRELGNRGARVEGQALKAGATVIQLEAERRAPRSDLEKQHMADNIIISGVKNKDGSKYVQVGPTRGDNSRYFYAKFLEWGTSKMPARPFLGPAASEKRKEAIDAVAEELRRGMGL